MLKGSAKNNNLAEYKEKLLKRNTALIKRAIAHIEQLGGEISMSIVSRISYEIAKIENDEKGITLAGISKNPIYKQLVEQAKVKNGLHNHNSRGAKINPSYISEGDAKLLLHAQRVENEQLKRDNRILLKQLQETPTAIEVVEPVGDELLREYQLLKQVVRSMVNRLCELEVAYVEAKTETLKVAIYNETIVNSDALKIFYRKELDEIHTNICRETADDKCF